MVFLVFEAIFRIRNPESRSYSQEFARSPALSETRFISRKKVTGPQLLRRTMSSFIACSHHRHGHDKTVLSWSCLQTADADKTRQFCLRPCRWCEQLAIRSIRTTRDYDYPGRFLPEKSKGCRRRWNMDMKKQIHTIDRLGQTHPSTSSPVERSPSWSSASSHRSMSCNVHVVHNISARGT